MGDQEQKTLFGRSVLLQNWCVEILTSKVTVAGGEAFGRRLGPEHRAFLNGISALVKET